MTGLTDDVGITDARKAAYIRQKLLQKVGVAEKGVVRLINNRMGIRTRIEDTDEDIG